MLLGLLIATASIRYYEATAEHRRSHPSPETFVGTLALARVTLPERTPRIFETKIGTIEPADHLLATLSEAQREYGSEVPYPIARLDLITSPRFIGTRFGAIGVYLGFREADGPPTFFILEAGSGAGDSKVLYFKEVGAGVISSFAGYKPTRYGDPLHVYVASLDLSQDAPERLQISARGLEGRTYMNLDVRFTEVETPTTIWPVLHTVRGLAMLRREVLYALVLILACVLVACRKKIDHPAGLATKPECARAGGEVCKACASLPACGWCGRPTVGEAQCQPQTETEAMPTSCLGEWTHNELGCPRPPPEGS